MCAQEYNNNSISRAERNLYDDNYNNKKNKKKLTIHYALSCSGGDEPNVNRLLKIE